MTIEGGNEGVTSPTIITSDNTFSTLIFPPGTYDTSTFDPVQEYMGIIGGEYRDRGIVDPETTNERILGITVHEGEVSETPSYTIPANQQIIITALNTQPIQVVTGSTLVKYPSSLDSALIQALNLPASLALSSADSLEDAIRQAYNSYGLPMPDPAEDTLLGRAHRRLLEVVKPELGTVFDNQALMHILQQIMDEDLPITVAGRFARDTTVPKDPIARKTIQRSTSEGVQVFSQLARKEADYMFGLGKISVTASGLIPLFQIGFRNELIKGDWKFFISPVHNVQEDQRDKYRPISPAYFDAEIDGITVLIAMCKMKK